MKIGVLTGGGDCPGLNAAIRAIVKYGSKRCEDSFLGVSLDDADKVLTGTCPCSSATGVDLDLNPRSGHLRLAIVGQGGSIITTLRFEFRAATIFP